MIDARLLLANYAEHDRNEVAQAIETLASLGVFQLLANANKQQILGRFDQGDPAELAKEILGVRQTNLILLALHESGRTIKEELKNA